MIIAAPLALKGAGGWSGLTETLPAEHFTVFGAPGVAASLGLFLPTFFLLLGESSIYQKFMSAKDENTTRRAVIGMILGVIVIETVLASAAIFGAGQYWNDPAFRTAAGGLDRASTETIILHLAAAKLPVIAGVLLLIGAAAIIFSTANTFLMVPSTNLTPRHLPAVHQPESRGQGHHLVSAHHDRPPCRADTLLVTTQFENILDMALYAYTMVGAAVTPALLAAFLWRRVTPIGGMVSIAAGMLGTIVFAAMARFGFEALNLGFVSIPLDYDYIIYPAGALSLISLFVVSWLTPESPREKWEPFLVVKQWAVGSELLAGGHGGPPLHLSSLALRRAGAEPSPSDPDNDPTSISSLP